jgi:circadian clock protein KaiB
VNGSGPGDLVLKLYIHGDSPRSERAVRRLNQICATREGCRVEIIDLSLHPEVARSERILATPSLVKVSPEPRRRIVGDLSDTAAVLQLLDVAEDQKEEAPL